MARGAIAYKGQLYLGGSKVEANPTGSAAGGNLSKLGVDDTIYAIPQANNGTLTIQKNGTNVATFSANQSSNATANIIVPDVEGTKSVSGNPLTLTDAAPINAESLVVELEPIQEGSGDPSPTNVRPITGYTECEVDDVGKNRFDISAIEQGGIYNSGKNWDTLVNYRRSSFILLKSGSYVIKRNANTDQWWKIYQYTEANEDSGVGFIFNKESGTAESFTVSENCYIRIAFDYIPTAVDEIQLEEGSQATPYEPYHSSNASIQFGQTVYGGSVDFVEGGTSDEFENVDLGELSWNKVATVSGKWRFEAGLYDFKKFPTGEVGTFKCSGYPTVSANGTWQGTFGLSGNGNYNSICVCDMSYSDATTFQTAMNGIQLVYEKATPTAIQTPPTELKLLKGTNNLSTNGTTINLGYQPDNVIGDVKGEIEAITEMDYLKILDNNVETPINNYRIYYHFISSAYTLVNMAEMLQHRFIFVEVIQNPSGTSNHNLLHSALIDPRTIDGFTYSIKASGNDTIWIESIIDENKFNLSLRTTGGSYSDGDPTDYYVTIRMVD